MRTLTPTPKEMSARIAYYRQLNTIAAQRDGALPLEVRDLIYARELLPVVGLTQGVQTAVSDSAPIQGAAGMTITYARCPPGQGPSLHAHLETFETFTVLRGRFEIRWGDEGEHAVELSPLDVISVPPRVTRAFRNVSNEEGILQVIITGGVHDKNDIDLSPHLARQIRDIDRTAFEKLSGMFTFTAGLE